MIKKTRDPTNLNLFGSCSPPEPRAQRFPDYSIDSMADFLTGLGINSGTAAVGILGHSLLLKMLTTVQFRAKLTMDPKTPQVSQGL